MTNNPHLFREPFTEAELREAWTDAVCATQTSAHSICRAGGVKMRGFAGHTVLMVDRCWCPEPHLISTESVDFERMRVRGDHIFCPIHDHKIFDRELAGRLPLGTRNDTKKRDALLAELPGARPTEPIYHCYQSGDGYTVTSIDADPVTALANARPSPKLPLRGVLLQCATLARARELVKLKSDDLFWCELHQRDDLDIDVGWHGSELAPQEKFRLLAQQQATAKQRRLERLKVVDRLRREAEQLARLPG
jgi:hypothetical protein